jgi:alpha-N-arabinofuranosidase
MKPEYYANIYKQYATFMASTNDKPIFKIASGANSDDLNWTEVLMRDIPKEMVDGLALHHYSVIDWSKKSSATNFSEADYFTTLKRAWKMEELVTKHSTIMDKYDPQKKIALVVDEWGGWYEVEPGTNPSFLYQQNTMRDAMIAGISLNIFNNHATRVRMANLAQTVNVLQAVILTNEEKMLLTPTYHVLEMFNVHQDATLLPTVLKSSDYENGQDKIQAISTSASKDKNGKTHISVVNIDPNKNHDIILEVRGEKITKVTGRILVSAKIQDHNTFESPKKIIPVIFKDFQITNNGIKFTMPPASVLVIEAIQ